MAVRQRDGRVKHDTLAAREQTAKMAPFGAAEECLIVPGVRGEQVAFVAYRLNSVRLSGVVEQFFAQAGDGHVDAAIHSVIGYAA